jgi:hypothetical protein
MNPATIQFRRNQLAWSLPLLFSIALGVAATLVISQIDLSLWTSFTAFILVGLALLQARSALLWYRCQYPLLEILDYCVFNTRTFKEWVLWEDVNEIVVDSIGTVFLRVHNEEKYVRSKKCFCDILAKLFNVEIPSKLILTPVGLDCSFGDLLTAVRSASRPYGTPIRRLSTSPPQRRRLQSLLQYFSARRAFG